MGKNKNKNKNYNSTSLAVSNKEVGSLGDKNTTQNDSKTTKFSYYYSKKKHYDCKGTRNKTKFPHFVDICKCSQEELKTELPELLLKEGYYDVVVGDGYIYAKGTIPVLLTAHMDTVHKELIKDFYEYYDKEKNQHILSSPQGIGGDDRCGIYMILEIIKTHKCSILFCEDEEIGGVGSSKFCKTDLAGELSELKYLIELDRANGTDAVFYDCANYDFIDFIEDNTGYKEDWGSFSDISNLSPECRVASVNLSCGYYNAHSTSEYVIVEEMLNTIETVKKLLDVECKQYEYIERLYGGYYGSWNNLHRDWYGDDYDGYYDDYYSDYYYQKQKSKQPSKYTNEKSEKEKSLFIYVYNEYIDEITTYVANGANDDEAFGKFFKNNPQYCFNDIYDYEFYNEKIKDDGWYVGY